jgi:hypothetical protein
VERRDPLLAGLRDVMADLQAQPPAGAATPTAFDRSSFIQLLRDKRYEEALDAMYRIREIAPDNPSVSRGIQILKDKLHAKYLSMMGDLDRVPTRTPRSAEVLAVLLPTRDEAALLRLADGIASLGDVFASSRLGRFNTARALAGLLERGVLTFEPPHPTPAPVRAGLPDPSAATAAAVAGSRAVPPGETDYEGLFREATEAYLRRDLPRACTLFERCRAMRPDDRRVQHNLDRLQLRMRAT